MMPVCITHLQGESGSPNRPPNRIRYMSVYPITHVAAACGTVWIGEQLFRRRGRGRSLTVSPRATFQGIDYRLVAFGALLPDLIDKPLAILVPAAFGDGHVIAHTLLFAAAIVLPGLHLARRGDPRVLSVGLAVLSHLAVDPVVLQPHTLFWPLLGFAFPDISGIPRVYLIAADAALIAAASLALVRSKRLQARVPDLLQNGRF